MASANLTDTSPVQYLHGVGESVATKLSKIGIETAGDLVENIPRSFDDYSRVVEISKVRPGKVTLKASIHNVKSRYSKNGLPITEAVARDGTGQLQLTWFSQPYIKNSIKPDTEYYISGEFAKNYRYFSIVNPKIELASAFPKHTARLVPNYRLTKGLSAHTMRKLIATALDSIDIKETLPAWIIEDLSLVSRDEALRAVHFPSDMNAFESAKKRLGFEELFSVMLASELNRKDFAEHNSFIHRVKERELKNFTDNLPFTLTDNQKIAAWKLLGMTTQDTPMNSLLQGDVGSGKTVVALLVAVNAIANGAQVALMAPTELLASQHYETIRNMLPLSLQRQTALLTGSLNTKDKKQTQDSIKSGEISLIVGTHALVQDKVAFKNLEFVIVDEQHRFGVNQRKALQNKADKMPHVLHMSATPIPRSIALTLYGELDVVTIKKKPSNRRPIKTSIISSDNRKDYYTKHVQTVIDRGEQVFVVAPLISDSEKSAQKYSVEKVSSELGRWLPDATIKVIHGKLSQEEKDEIMLEMKRGKVDVLIATTVIEVGIDIPNATLMVIENADSFGLAQLHQLRGRVGRGDKQSNCVLVSTSQDANQRLRALESETSGFKLAEYDLELRGPGAIYGSMQHGALDLRIAKISDTALIESAREQAKKFITMGEKLVKYQALDMRVASVRAITNLN